MMRQAKMNPTPRPDDTAPGGMHGSSRMFDPSEAGHDRVRRRLMNLAFVLVALLAAGDAFLTGLRGADWATAILVAVAAAPLGMAVKIFELRFKMAPEERRQALREIPARKTAEFVLFAALLTGAVALHVRFTPWALLGVWFYDFVTYYHDRPERMRHLYAVTMTLDELRSFPAPWVWPLPALAFELCLRLT